MCIRIVLALVLLAFSVGVSRADPYTLIVGTPAQSPYVLHARVIATHLPRFLPGTPAMDVKIMPAAFGTDALRYIAEMKSERMLAFIPPNALWDTLLGRQPAGMLSIWNFPIVGIATRPDYVCVANKSLTLDDMRRESIVAGSPSPQMLAAMLPRVYNHVLGTQFRVVAGYSSWAQILQLIEQGEVGILCGFDVQYVLTQFPTIGKPVSTERGLRVVMVESLLADRRFPWALQLAEVMSPSARATVSALLGANPGRALHAAPRADVALLRQAFDRMIEDPQYLVDLAHSKQMHNPLDSRAAEAHYATLQMLSPSIWRDVDAITRGK